MKMTGKISLKISKRRFLKSIAMIREKLEYLPHYTQTYGHMMRQYLTFLNKLYTLARTMKHMRKISF